MNGTLIRGIAMQGKVRFFAVDIKPVLEQLRQRHNTSATASAALGRTLSTAAMMGAMLKDEQKLTLQVKGNGPLGQIVVDANAAGVVRGYVENPQADLPKNEKGKLDVAGIVGKEGAIYVAKDLGLREPYHGSVPIISGELAEDFTYYFASSEQTPSAVSVGVLVERDLSIRQAGGFIIQLMPEIGEDEITFVEKRLEEIPSMTDMLEKNMTLDDIVKQVVPDVRVMDEMDIRFQCKCSRERVDGMILQLGEEEIREMIEKDHGAEVTCHFCNEIYTYSESDLEALLVS